MAPEDTAGSSFEEQWDHLPGRRKRRVPTFSVQQELELQSAVFHWLVSRFSY